MSDDLTKYTAKSMRELIERVARLQVVTDVSNGEARAIVSLQSPDGAVDVAELQRRAASLLENERTHRRICDFCGMKDSPSFAKQDMGEGRWMWLCEECRERIRQGEADWQQRQAQSQSVIAVGATATAEDGTTYPVVLRLDGQAIATAVIRHLPNVIRRGTDQRF